MPRPTPAQLIYGSVTVVLSALAMLLLSQTQSGPGVALIVVAATVLGVLVALTVPVVHTARRARMGGARPGTARTQPRTQVHGPSAPASASRVHARHSAPAAPAAAHTAHQQGRPVAAPSLHR